MAARAAFASLTAQSESGGRDFTPAGAPVTSPKGALYAMQVMPSTAHNPGFGIAPAQSDTPQEFNRVGQAYLTMLQRRYSGDPAKMWAAYNAGPGRVDQAIRTGGSNWLSSLPRETQSYVARNMRTIGG